MPNKDDKFKNLTPKHDVSDDAVFDLLFKHAVKEHLNEKTNPLPTRDTLKKEVSFTADFEDSMQKRMGRWTASKTTKKQMSRFSANLLKVAAVFLAVILVSGMFIVTSNAARVKVLNFFKSVTDISTDIAVQEDDVIGEDVILALPVEAYKPMFLPKGVELINVINSPDLSELSYLGKSGEILQIRTYHSTLALSLNSENAKETILEINGVEARQIITENDTTIYYEINNEIVLLYSDLKAYELKKIAESLRK